MTLYEQNGDLITDTLRNSANQVVSLSENQRVLNQTVEGLDASPAVLLQTALANLQIALAPLLRSVAEIVGRFAEFASNNAGLISVIVAVGTALGIVSGALIAILPAIGGLVTALPILTAGFAAISAPILIVIGAITALAVAFTALYANSQVFRDGVGEVFNQIRLIAETVFGAIVAFVQTSIQQILDFWNTNGAQILEAAQNVFNGIMAAVEFVFPAIQFIVETVWQAIQNVISGALDIILGLVRTFSGVFTGDFSAIWEGIQQIFRGAIDLILGLMTLSFFGGIRTAVVSFARTFSASITSLWTATVTAFKTGVSNAGNVITGFTRGTIDSIKTFSTGFVNIIRDLGTSVVSKFNELKTGITNVFSNFSLFNTGRELINGLIRGITNRASAVIETMTGVVEGVIDRAKRLLRIQSPSRVFREIGLFTGEGLAIGIGDSSETVNNAMESIFNGLLNSSKDFNDEFLRLQSEFNRTNQERSNSTSERILKIQNQARRNRRSLTQSEIREISNLRNTEQRESINARRTFENNYNKLVDDSNKAQLEVIQNYISERRSLGQLSIADEIRIREETLNIFAEGTDQRLKAQQDYAKALESLNNQIVSINTNYSNQIQTIDTNLTRSIEEQNARYTNAFEARRNTLLGFAGIFDEFVIDTEVSGQQLTNNLQSQVVALEEFTRQITLLSNRGINDELFNELSNLGVRALPQLIALQRLTDEELENYSNIYRDRARLAREQAERELAPLNADVRLQIQNLRTTATQQLDALNVEWRNEILRLTTTTNDELMTLESIGLNAGLGLLRGLTSTESSLYRKAKEIANGITRTIQESLDINSPSRVMAALGVNIGEGLIVGMNDTVSRVALASSNLSDAVQNAQFSLNNSSNNSNNNRLANNIVQNNNNSRIESLIEAVLELAQRPIQTVTNLDGRVLSNSTSVFQANNASIAALQRGVQL